MVTGSTALFVAPVVTLVLVASVLLIFRALQRCAGTGAGAGAADRERAPAAAEDGGGKGLSADELQTLPCHGFLSNGAAAAADCAVCLEAFEAGDRCRRLPSCEHSFHAKCVDPWLEKSRCCPVCRADVVPKGELVKVAVVEGALAVEMTVEMAAPERRSSAALELAAIERLQQYSWTLHPGVVLH